MTQLSNYTVAMSFYLQSINLDPNGTLLPVITVDSRIRNHTF